MRVKFHQQLMKILEMILVVCVAASAMLFIGSAAQGGQWLIISAILLSSLYLLFSFALLHGIGFRKIVGNQSFQGIDAKGMIGAILIGLMLSLTVFGIICRWMWWADIYIALVPGVLGLLISAGIIWQQRKKNASRLYPHAFRRVIIYGILGIFFILIPADFCVKIKYHQYPDYVETVLEANRNPENQDLRQRADDMYKDLFGNE